MIPIAASVRIWIATGHTDMRNGMRGLALQVQEGLGRDPFQGDVFVFRGRRGSLIKAIWHDGVGLPTSFITLFSSLPMDDRHKLCYEKVVNSHIPSGPALR